VVLVEENGGMNRRQLQVGHRYNGAMLRPMSFLSPAPPIETERLRLRGHQLEHFSALAAMWTDPITTRYIGGKPCNEQESWSRLLRYVGHWALLGFGYWAVEEKSSGKFIGETGFANLKRSIEPSLGDTPEIGWVFASESHGKGYAAEAVRAVIAWGESHFARRETTCIIHSENVRSIHLAEKFGYRQVRTAMYEGHATLVFVR
jgi:RimJ/RimL family protein N-acetyltransferase